MIPQLKLSTGSHYLLLGVLILCVVGGLLVAPGAVGAQEDDDDTPPVPAAYYGSVTVDGEPAEAGVDVTAEVEGTTYGPLSTDEDGEFGGPTAADEKLVVDPDDTPDDPEVTFLIEGEEVDTTATWEAGANDQVSLSIDELPDSDDGDDETDDGTDDGSDDDSDAADDSDDGSGTGDDGAGGGGEPNPPVHGDDDDADGTEAETEAPSVEDVRTDLEETEPDTETSTEITDSDRDTSGVTVETEDAESVDQITFGEDATGSVDVREYQDPPESVSESVSAAVAADTDTDAASDDGTQASTSASVVSVAEISPTDETTASSAATVSMTVDRDDISDPDDAVITHEQDDSWKQLDTNVQDSDEDEVTLAANVDSFSLFAVAETSTQQAEPTDPDETDDGDDVGDDADDETDDSIPGFGIPAALAALLAVALLAYQRRQ